MVKSSVISSSRMASGLDGSGKPARLTTSPKYRRTRLAFVALNMSEPPVARQHHTDDNPRRRYRRRGDHLAESTTSDEDARIAPGHLRYAGLLASAGADR